MNEPGLNLAHHMGMKITLGLAIILFFSNCSHRKTYEERQEAPRSTVNLEDVYDAIEKRSLPKLERAVRDQTLRGQTKLHNMLNCGDGPIAAFLIEKGAYPKEEEALNPVVNNNFLGTFPLRAPLESSLKRGCTDLAEIYLDHMTFSEVAKASLTVDLTDLPHEWEPRGMSLDTASGIKESLDLARKKNSILCTNGYSENCLALSHLDRQLNLWIEDRAQSLLVYACYYRSKRKIFNDFTRLYLQETGEGPRLSQCKRWEEHS